MRFKTTRYFFISLCMLFLSCSAATAVGTVKKSYPPYPDVWGYDLSELPAMQWGAVSVFAYAMDDGDIWFLMTHSYKTSNPMDFFSPDTDRKWFLLKFFKGEQTELSAQAVEEVFKVTEGKEVEEKWHTSELMTFRDGSKLSVHYGSMPKMCFIPSCYRNYFIKTDMDGKETKYSVLVAAPQVRIYQDENFGEAEGAPFFYEKLCSFTSIVPLKDDTFIVFENGGNVILRLDKDLKTNFKPITPLSISGKEILRNFFIVDYSLIEGLLSQFILKPIPVYQNVHDALLLHFYNQYHS